MQLSKGHRRGLSLLELIIASTLMTTLVASTAMLMRSSHEAWLATEADNARLDAAAATVRHIVRQVRQAKSVTAISAAAATSGNLSLLMPSGSTHVWNHQALAKTVSFGVTSATSVLADEITELKFTGYKADGVTATTVPAEIHLIRCEAAVSLPRGAGITRRTSGYAWIRCW